jgi:hypothetical protein
VTLFAASIYWDLPVLLVVVSLVYSGTRHDRWDRILLEAGGWGLRIVGFLAMIGGALYVLSTFVEWRTALIAVMVVGGVAYTTIGHFYSKAQAKKAEAAGK